MLVDPLVKDISLLLKGHSLYWFKPLVALKYIILTNPKENISVNR